MFQGDRSAQTSLCQVTALGTCPGPSQAHLIIINQSGQQPFNATGVSIINYTLQQATVHHNPSFHISLHIYIAKPELVNPGR